MIYSVSISVPLSIPSFLSENLWNVLINQSLGPIKTAFQSNVLINHPRYNGIDSVLRSHVNKFINKLNHIDYRL